MGCARWLLAQVSVTGDFNNWNTKAAPMHKGPDGVCHLSLSLKPGRYEHRSFAGEVWCDDPAAQQKAANSMGTENCVRIVFKSGESGLPGEACWARRFDG